jgi:5'-nucleotidase (lipoprotein e(P4) family)
MRAMKRLAYLLATLASTACTGETDDGDRTGVDVIVGDEDKADGATGVELTGWLAVGTPTNGTVSPQVPRIAYLFQAAAGTKVDVEVTQAGTAAGIDTIVKVYGPRNSDGSYPVKIAEDDDAGYGKLSKVSGRDVPGAGVYLVEVTLKTAPTEPKNFRLALRCTGSCERTGPAAPIGLDIRWSMKSAEYRAASLQAYAVATQRLEAMARPAEWAVVLDIDETTLSNVQYQFERAELGTAYSPVSWLAWVKREAAPAMPGAKAFIQRARALGGKVILVSNRKEAGECGPTRANLTALGIPFDGTLCRTDTSDKNPRFESIEDGTTGIAGLPAMPVLMFVGDNILDFPNLDQDIRDDGDTAFADFQERFVVIPNPMYGSWEKNP